MDPVETITSELLPLCAALRFLGRRGAKILAPRHLGWLGRPLWLFGVRSVVQRAPLGEVLVLGAWNYPLLLPGVQVAQALAAGNRVRLKPAPGTERATEILVDCFYSAGVPREQLELLGSDKAAAIDAIDSGADLIVLTGGSETGRQVLRAAAPHLSASVLELGGCDAVVVLPGYDLERLIQSIRFGLQFNGGATCIGPRRLLVRDADHDAIVAALTKTLADESSVVVHPAARQSVMERLAAAIEHSARDVLGNFCADRLRDSGELKPVLLDGVSEKDDIAASDLFAPVLSVITVADEDQAVRIVNDCPYRLAAGVFGPQADAQRVAERLQVGTVTINDLLAPTADPRVPFGGRGNSGFGVTRGAEGLLAMTTPKVIGSRRGKIAPHLRPRSAADKELLHGVLQMNHGGGMRKRFAGLRRMIAAIKSS